MRLVQMARFCSNVFLIAILFFLSLAIRPSALFAQSCTGSFRCYDWILDPREPGGGYCCNGVNCTNDHIEECDQYSDQLSCVIFTCPYGCAQSGGLGCTWHTPDPVPTSTPAPTPAPGEVECFRCVNGNAYCESYFTVTCNTNCNACPGGTPTPTATPYCTISIPPNPIKLSVGGSRVITPEITYSGSSVRQVSFVSGDESKFTVEPALRTTSPFNTTLTGVATGSNIPFNVQALLNSGGTCSVQGLVNIVLPEAWWAVLDGDIVGNGNIISDLPATANYDLINSSTGFMPGIALYKTSIAPGPNAVKPKISSTNWNVDGGYLFPASEMNFDHFSALVPTQVTFTTLTGTVGNNAFSCPIGGSNYYDGYCWFDTSGDLAIEGEQQMGNDKIILFVNGKLNINTDNWGSTAGKGIVVIFAKDDISVNAAVGGKNPDLSGVFFTDKRFYSGAGTQTLKIRGTVSALTGVTLQRNMGEKNPTDPGEYFQFAPDYMFTFPKYFAQKTTSWKEVLP